MALIKTILCFIISGFFVKFIVALIITFNFKKVIIIKNLKLKSFKIKK